MIDSFTQLGIAGATLGILAFIVRYFIQTVSKKDDQIFSMMSKFNNTMDIHLKRRTKVAKKETKTLQSLADAINKLEANLKK